MCMLARVSWLRVPHALNGGERVKPGWAWCHTWYPHALHTRTNAHTHPARPTSWLGLVYFGLVFTTTPPRPTAHPPRRPVVYHFLNQS